MKHRHKIAVLLGSGILALSPPSSTLPLFASDEDFLVHQEIKEPLKLAEALAFLKNSKESEVLEKAAVSLCMIGTPEALDQLSSFLQEPEFLNRLDPLENYSAGTTYILKNLGKLSTPKAEGILLKLADNKVFKVPTHLHRALGLIEACGSFHNPSPKLLAFLDSEIKPKGPSGQAIGALAGIRTPEAWALIEKHVLSDEFDNSEKEGLFENTMLPSRNNPAVVELYKKVLSSDLKDVSLRNTIVQTLFDYRPYQWCHPDGAFPKPPSRQEASPETLKELMAIVQIVWKLDLLQETRDGILKSQEEIQRLLENKLKFQGTK